MKILLLRFSSIGDIVLTTPVARCLHEQLGAEVHFLTKQAFAPILTPNPHIARVFSFQKEVDEVLPVLRAEGYDWVIDLHRNLRSWRVKLALGRPARSFDKLNLEKWLLVNFKIDRLPKVHIVDRYMKTVAPLGVRYDGRGLDYFIPEDQEIQSSRLSPSLSEGNYLTFVIGATHATKRLPPEKMLEFCRLAAPQPIVLLGGPAEKEQGAWLAQSAGPHVINACGQLSLHQSASLVRQAKAVVTHDTGLMHIAAAFRKPIASIWGNTIPEFGMYPFFPDRQADQPHSPLELRAEVPGLPCRPCSKIGFEQCPRGHFRCMKDQDMAALWKEICSK